MIYNMMVVAADDYTLEFNFDLEGIMYRARIKKEIDTKQWVIDMIVAFISGERIDQYDYKWFGHVFNNNKYIMKHAYGTKFA